MSCKSCVVGVGGGTNGSMEWFGWKEDEHEISGVQLRMLALKVVAKEVGELLLCEQDFRDSAPRIRSTRNTGAEIPLKIHPTPVKIPSFYTKTLLIKNILTNLLS